MFKDKGSKIEKKKIVDNVKGTIAFINIVDVHVETTKSKATKVQVLKEWNWKNNKSVVDWEVEERLKKSMFKSIQIFLITFPIVEVPSTTKGDCDISWAILLNLVTSTKNHNHKYLMFFKINQYL